MLQMLITTTEVLKIKEIITDDDLERAYKRLKANHNRDEKSSEGHPIQSKDTGSDENHSGHGGPTLLRDEISGADLRSTEDQETSKELPN